MSAARDTHVSVTLDAYRARLLTAYITTSDEWKRLALQAEAMEYDLAHPPRRGETTLAAEMRAATAGDTGLEVAA